LLESALLRGMKERLHKILADRGVASRRACEQLMRAGRVTVNGMPVRQPGFEADLESDVIQVDGRLLPPVVPERIVIALNKPAGYLSTCSAMGGKNPTILDLVPSRVRLFPVGRLDRDSSGLLLLTNDGPLANRIMHPRFGYDKEYSVRVWKPLETLQWERLRRGVLLNGHTAKPLALRRVNATTFLITMGEGRKREIRRMVKAIGNAVVELHRIRIGPLSLGDIPPGHWRKLTATEIEELCSYRRETSE
jgi:23S rRNA pseudouridine2605 synthase